MKTTAKDIPTYNEQQKGYAQICSSLMKMVDTHLPYTERKIWHGSPVWFINENPIVGYSVQKKGVRLMFWSGKSFDEDALNVRGEKFKDASIFYTNGKEVQEDEIKRWLKKSETIQWDYKNIVKRKGKLLRI